MHRGIDRSRETHIAKHPIDPPANASTIKKKKPEKLKKQQQQQKDTWVCVFLRKEERGEKGWSDLGGEVAQGRTNRRTPRHGHDEKEGRKDSVEDRER